MSDLVILQDTLFLQGHVQVNLRYRQLGDTIQYEDMLTYSNSEFEGQEYCFSKKKIVGCKKCCNFRIHKQTLKYATALSYLPSKTSMMGSRSDNGQGKSSQVDYIRYQRHNHTCMHPDILNGQSFMLTNQYVNPHVNQTINQHVQPFNLATKLSSPNSLEYFVVSNQFHSSSRHLVARDGYSNNFKETNEDDALPLPCFIEPEIFPSSSKSAAVMLSKPHVFPAFFNPRKAANMPANEKVHNWMVNIPYHYQNNKLHMDCFPAVTSLNVSSSGNSLDSDQPEEYGLKTDIYNEVFPDPARSKNVKLNQVDFSETDAILEFQARKITRYILKIYDNEPENVALGDYRGGERMHCKQNLQDDVYEEESYYDDDEDEIVVETTDGKYFGRYLGTGNGI